MKNHNCKVCGLCIDDAPWGEDNKFPTYEICPCCGVEFGNEDYALESVRRYRSQWINKSSEWFNKKAKPSDWNKEEQMKSIPSEWI